MLNSGIHGSSTATSTHMSLSRGALLNQLLYTLFTIKGGHIMHNLSVQEILPYIYSYCILRIYLISCVKLFMALDLPAI